MGKKIETGLWVFCGWPGMSSVNPPTPPNGLEWTAQSPIPPANTTQYTKHMLSMCRILSSQRDTPNTEGGRGGSSAGKLLYTLCRLSATARPVSQRVSQPVSLPVTSAKQQRQQQQQQTGHSSSSSTRSAARSQRARMAAAAQQQ